MRAVCLLAACSLLTAVPSPLIAQTDKGVPVAARQTTGDAWDMGMMSLKAPCQPILSDLAFPVAPDARDAAEGFLKTISVVPIEEPQAAGLLGRDASGHLLGDMLLDKARTMMGQKNSSVTDQMTIHDLIQAAQPHYPPYRAYLVRALVGARTQPSNFNIKLCGDTLLIDNLSDGDKASRLPMIVYLQAKPVTVAPSWYSPVR